MDDFCIIALFNNMLDNAQTYLPCVEIQLFIKPLSEKLWYYVINFRPSIPKALDYLAIEVVINVVRIEIVLRIGKGGWKIVDRRIGIRS